MGSLMTVPSDNSKTLRSQMSEEDHFVLGWRPYGGSNMPKGASPSFQLTSEKSTRNQSADGASST